MHWGRKGSLVLSEGCGLRERHFAHRIILGRDSGRGIAAASFCRPPNRPGRKTSFELRALFECARHIMNRAELQTPLRRDRFDGEEPLHKHRHRCNRWHSFGCASVRLSADVYVRATKVHAMPPCGLTLDRVCGQPRHASLRSAPTHFVDESTFFQVWSGSNQFIRLTSFMV